MKPFDGDLRPLECHGVSWARGLNYICTSFREVYRPHVSVKRQVKLRWREYDDCRQYDS
jgi:hypothetical protein